MFHRAISTANGQFEFIYYFLVSSMFTFSDYKGTTGSSEKN